MLWMFLDGKEATDHQHNTEQQLKPLSSKQYNLELKLKWIPPVTINPETFYFISIWLTCSYFQPDYKVLC
jgi:hypothetical protein